MPSGKIHAQDSVLIAVVAGGIMVYSGSDIVSSLALSVGSLTGVILSPDLDQDGLTISETSIIRRIPVLGWLFYLYWFPYAKLIPHRHWTSHAPVLGTLGRLLYLAPIFVLLLHLGIDWYNLTIPTAPFLIGLALSDLMHWLRDSL